MLLQKDVICIKIFCHVFFHPWMKNIHSNLNQIVSKRNKETSNDSKKSHPYIHEWENNKDITMYVSRNKKFLQSEIYSPQRWMKFLQQQMNQVLSKRNHESSSDSNAYHRCIHVDVHHHKVKKEASANVNNQLRASFTRLYHAPRGMKWFLICILDIES